MRHDLLIANLQDRFQWVLDGKNSSELNTRLLLYGQIFLDDAVCRATLKVAPRTDGQGRF